MLFLKSPPSSLVNLATAICILTLAACASSEPASSAAPTPGNVVAASAQRSDLSTFHKLVQQAGLNPILESTPVTVFAPTDEAFKALPAAKMDQLSKNPEQLKAVLAYHVVPGVVKAGDIHGSSSMTTQNGAKVAVSRAGDFVTVDDSLVTQADLPAGNGVIHVIDRVLTPPAAK